MYHFTPSCCFSLQTAHFIVYNRKHLTINDLEAFLSKPEIEVKLELREQ